jgi:uncharacterized membrane protein
MRSKFAFQGHPLHPMLVTLPIGLFVWTLVADFVFLGTNNAIWFEIARWTGVAAIVSALVAALPGVGDYLTMGMRGRARQAATAHMALNFAVVSVYVVAAVVMFGGFQGLVDDVVPTTAAYVVTGLHAFGVLLLLGSGWLGGEMVYRHRLGVMTEAATGVDGADGRGHRPGAREPDATEKQRMDRERERDVTERQRMERARERERTSD